MGGISTVKILVAEDDVKLNNGIVLALQNDHIELIQSYRYRECLEAVDREKPQLLILDINFPDGDGLDILREIRSQQMPVKVILLTANNMESDIVSGLELGADDYVTKPFSLMVLRSRVRVQLRSIEQSAGDSCDDSHCFNAGRFSFDFERMIFQVDGEAVELSKTEQKLLRFLVQNRGITLRRERLIDEVWNGESEFVDEHALTVTMKRLRDKLKDNGTKDAYIKTVYGIGYTWIK